MKAIRYDGPGSYALTDLPIPEPGPGQVLVKVIQAGFCATDLHIHRGEYIAAYPVIPGHEPVGTVAALGEGVTRFRVGEQVTVNPNIPCGGCTYCLAGRVDHCIDPTAIGVTYDGAFAEYECVPQLQVFSVEGLPIDTAVFTEPTACAMHGLERLRVRPGSSALVLGSGSTGLLLAQLIGSGGASSVTVAGPVPFQLETAAALGITNTVPIRRGEPEDNLRLLREASGDDGYDVVVEATGAVEVGNICVPLTRNGGTVLIYGVTTPDDRISIPPFDMFRREITVKGSFAEMTTFGAAIAALRAGRARTDGIITHRFGLGDYDKALDALAHDETVHKVVIVP
jgi:D-arabinitol dehydrogenase (NADP+)